MATTPTPFDAAAAMARIRAVMRERGQEPTPACVCGGEAGYTVHAVDGRMTWRLCPCMEDCGECVGGDVEYERDGYRFVRPCPRCATPRRVVDTMAAARLPERHDPRQGKPLNKAQRALFTALRAWVKAYGVGSAGLTLSGPPGVGKSYAVVAALRALVETHGVRVQYAHLPSLLRELRAARDEVRDSDERLEALVRVPVLGLDELSALRTDWQRETVADLLCARYDARRTTLLTTNLDEHALAALWGSDVAGERIASRLAEWAPIVRITGEDVRR